MNELILIAESLSFLGGSVVLYRREKLFGVYFFALFVYTVFSQIGYLYVPDLSAQIFAYFGEGVWRTASIFIICSAITLLCFLRYASFYVEQAIKGMTSSLSIYSTPGRSSRRVVCGYFICTLVMEWLLFAVRYQNISWDSAQQEDLFSSLPLVGMFVLLVKLSVGTNIALYCSARQARTTGVSRYTVPLLLLISLASFLVFTFKLGNRTDNIALALGVSVFEISQVRLGLRHFVIAGVLATVLVGYLNILEASRYSEAPSDTDFLTKMLVKDYFAPAHVLFAAVAFDVVEPVTVASSNVSNALMFLKQPYLQADVMERFFPGGATRNASYGFYALTEGYMFAGFWGFVYNGLVLGLMLSLWMTLSKTSSKHLNMFLMALSGSMVINLVRGQSSYFVKYLYTYVLPSTIVFLALSGERVRWVSRSEPAR